MKWFINCSVFIPTGIWIVATMFPIPSCIFSFCLSLSNIQVFCLPYSVPCTCVKSKWYRVANRSYQEANRSCCNKSFLFPNSKSFLLVTNRSYRMQIVPTRSNSFRFSETNRSYPNNPFSYYYYYYYYYYHYYYYYILHLWK